MKADDITALGYVIVFMEGLGYYIDGRVILIFTINQFAFLLV